MSPSEKMTRKFTSFRNKTLRGLSLLEAMLALGIGGLVITQSIFGIAEYTSGVQVQATASKVAILNRAAEKFAEDNFSNLVANAPQELPISALEPYTGDNIGPDAFGNTYVLSTRTYQITVPDPVNGGTKNEQALQVLVVGQFADPTETAMTEKLTLRSDIANTAGSAAGFIASDELTCPDGVGGLGPDGTICGAFGSYSINSASFAATDFTNAAVVSLVTRGDSSIYGDQLYRYDYGDPELNTMHTDLYMEDNDIIDPDMITGVNGITLNNPTGSVIETETGAIALRGATSATVRAVNGGIFLNSSSNTYTLSSNDPATVVCNSSASCTDDFPTFGTTNGKLRITTGETVFGDKQNFEHNGRTLRTGTANIWADVARINSVQANSVNSLFNDPSSALHLQNNRDFGEVIIGKRARYNPDGAGGIYELAQGNLTAQHVQVQDITCADCGGSLASILPKWRHMGTYYIPDGTARTVPKPNCTDNRARNVTRAAIGDELAYAESARDERYEAKIILVPRQFAFADNSQGTGVIDFRFTAIDGPGGWLTSATVTNGMASALAKTYCVFTGGNVDPTAAGSQVSGYSDPSFVTIE
jgi:hypothetical protein